MIQCHGKTFSNTRMKQLFFLLFNFFSTIAITFINKICFSNVEFGYPAALSNIHFAITWVGVASMRRLNLFEPLGSTPSLLDKDFAAIVIFVGTVTPLNNTSLQLNSMGFYQIFKLLVTPMVVLLEYVLDSKTLSHPRIIFLTIVCVSVLLSSFQDAQFSAYGVICATIWVPLAAGYKVQWGRVLRKYDCSTLALMYTVLPYAIIIQTFMELIVDPPGLFSFQWTWKALLWVSLSGIAAFMVNLSGFLVMGGVGALAHILLGQLKSAVICLGAYYLFNATYNTIQLVGFAGAVIGIIAYTHVTVSEKERRRKEKKLSFDKEN